MAPKCADTPVKVMTLEERLRSKIKYRHFCSRLDLKSPSEMVVPFDRSSTNVVILAGVCTGFMHMCI